MAPQALIALAMVSVLGSLAGCGLLGGDPPPAETRLLTEVRDVSALATDGQGRVLVAERSTGRILAVEASGGSPEVLETVSLDHGEGEGEGDGGGRGVVGLAVDEAGRLFVSVVDGPERRLRVEEVSPTRRVVWEGPTAGDRTPGGALVAEPGRLVVAVGSTGTLVSLRPDGPPTQAPVVLAEGLGDPTGVTRGPGGDWWVVSRAGDGTPARLARVIPGGRLVVTDLTEEVVPVGVVSVGEGRLGVCDAAGAAVRVVVVRDGAAGEVGHVLAEGCSRAAVGMANGEVAIASDAELRAFVPPPPEP